MRLEFSDASSGPEGFAAMLRVWGNGNAARGYMLFYALTMRLAHARLKHPLFAEGRFQALGVIGAEYEELVAAIERESEARQKDEALDVTTTCLRFLNGEHGPEQWQGIEADPGS